MDDTNVTKCVKNADEVIDSAVTSGVDQSKTVLNQTRDLPTRSKPVEISCEVSNLIWAVIFQNFSLKFYFLIF